MTELTFSTEAELYVERAAQGMLLKRFRGCWFVVSSQVSSSFPFAHVGIGVSGPRMFALTCVGLKCALKSPSVMVDSCWLRLPKADQKLWRSCEVLPRVGA